MNLSDYLEGKSKTEFAKRMKVPVVLISQWTNGVRRVPAERCPQIEKLTAGAVRCEDLRPDVDWGVLRCPQPDNAADAARNSGAVGLSEDEAA